MSLYDKKTISDQLKDLRIKIQEWYDIDFSEFPYFYISYGITDGLNHVLENQSIHMWEDDYSWPKLFFNHKLLKNFELPSQRFYMSNPSSIDGKWKDIPKNVPIILDLAYLTSTFKRQIKLPQNVEVALVGLSKGMGLETKRLGAIFSKYEIPKKEVLQDLGYFDHSKIELWENYMKIANVESSWKKYYNKYKELCNLFSLKETETFLFALAEKNRYKELKNYGEYQRVCLTPLL